MCGILGEFGKALTSKNSFREILHLSKNRGPDMHGIYKDSDIQFGFNRLSILDTTSNGNQPILSPSKRYVIVCNGEILNYKKLIKRLNIQKKDLRSSVDIEVIGHALDNWGYEKTIKNIIGMFAIAIFDKHHKKLYLARDIAGIKPLYFGIANEGIIFASQYDQIFKHIWFKYKKNINTQALSDYLKLGYIPSPSALFNDSWLIGPGEIFCINADFKIEKNKYFSFIETDDYKESEDLTLSKLNQTFNDIMPDYINSDVPVGTFLSGGVDSPLINGIVSKQSNQITSFTVSSRHSNIDEAINAKAIARYLKIKHETEKFNESNIKSWIDNHFKAFSEPFSDYSSLPMYMLCESASKSFKVMIAGDGADEIFWGYPRYLRTIDYINWFKYPIIVRRLSASLLRKTGKNITSGIECSNIGNWVFERMGPFYSQDVQKLIPDYCFSNETENLYNFSKKNISRKELLRWLRKNDFYGHMQRRLLKVDRASMDCGIEVRVPYLDQRMIEFGLKIEPELGINHKEPKTLLKKNLHKYVPKELLLKEKQGFSVDLGQILRFDLKEEVEDVLNSKNLFASNIIDSDILKINVNDYMCGKNNNPWEIWTLFALNKFAIVHELV
jgi:asparagine synthase (glutamine-hydrolysing)